MRIPVALLGGTFRRGGGERDLLELLRRLDRSRFDLHMLYVERVGDLLPEYEATGVPLHPLGFSSLKSAAAFRALPAVRGYLRQHRVRIIQGFGVYASLYAAMMAREIPGLAVVSYEFTSSRRRSLREMLFQPWYYRRSDAIVGNSDAVLRMLARRRGVKSDRLVKIHNGVDVVRFHPAEAEGDGAIPGVPPGTPVAGIVGRLHPIKGHRYAVRAWPRVLDAVPEARLVMVGGATQAQRAGLEREIRSAGCGDRIIMLGSREDVPRLLPAMDLVVVPSLAEGFSNAVIEAGASGRPVVATRVGGNPEAIVDNETGLLVPPRDPAALASAIIRLLRDGAARRRMGEAARERVARHFTVTKMVEQYAQLYMSLAHGT